MRKIKKLIAVLCTITLVIGSMSVYGASVSDGDKDGDVVENPWGELFTTTAPGETTNPGGSTNPGTSGASEYDWSSVGFLGGEVADQYKVVVVEGDVNEVVNIQTPGFAAETGIYVTFPDANFGQMTVDGSELGASVEGAGVIMHLSNFADTYSEVEIKNADGTLKARLYVYNAKGNDAEITTTVPVETTPEPTAPGTDETTTAPGTDETTTATQPTTNVVDNGASEYDWSGESFLGGEVANQYKVVVVEGDVNEVVNIQTPGFAAETGIYVTFPNADFGQMTVNGTELGSSVEGAGVIMHLSNFTDKFSVVEIKNSDGSLKAKLYVYNENGYDENATTTPGTDETTTAPDIDETTTAPDIDVTTTAPDTDVTTTPGTDETTTAPNTDATTTAPSQTTFTECIADSEWHTYGGYLYYVGTWNGSTAQIAVDPTDSDHIQMQQLTSNWSDAWGLQVKKNVAGLEPGKTYTVSLDMYSPSTDGSYMITNDAAGTKRQLTVGTTTLSADIVANDAGEVEFSVGLGWVGTSVVLDFSNVKVTDENGNVVYPNDGTDETTTAPGTDATTTAPGTDVTTTAPGTDTTTPVVTTPQTTTTPQVTTKQPTTTTKVTVITVKKSKVKKATKKLSLKKINLKLKKVKGATRYQIQISKNKKFKKKLVKKNVKKVKVTIKSKKLVNKKKLYVRVRACKVVNGKKYYSKWSKAKKVKIKK